jgi:hypothetical protein
MAAKKKHLTQKQVTELQHHLQTALEVELSTVPIYLYTYYSINRAPSWEDDKKEGNVLATFANKAGGVIMSVVVEEMLHMSLAANILRAIGGKPKVYGRSPKKFPTNLPHHEKKDKHGNRFSFDLSKLSADQLHKFLEIEQPEKKGAPPEGKKWETLGQFYDYISEKIKLVDPEIFRRHAETQLQESGGYYAPNNVDTIYPKDASWVKKQIKPDAKHPSHETAHQAHFTNNKDSGDIRVITSIKDALNAMEIIKHQGEGYTENDHKDDDKQGNEESHWYRFHLLHEECVRKGSVVKENLNQALFPCFVDHPTKASWSNQTKGASDDVIDLVNAVYSYILYMTEVSYTLLGHAQHTFFYIGMHKGMIFILDKLIGNMRWAKNYPKGFGPSKGFQGLAPTFENYKFSSLKKARSELTALADKVHAALPGVCDDNIWQRIHSLPDLHVKPGHPISFGSPKQ